MKKPFIIFILALSGMCGFTLSLYFHARSQTDSNDIPVIQTFHTPAIFVKQLEGDPRAGEKIFKEFCASCHANEPIIDIKAPRIGDKKAWQSREKQGMETLLKITANGAGAMPARGGCFECSDDQLRAAIHYILRQNQ